MLVGVVSVKSWHTLEEVCSKKRAAAPPGWLPEGLFGAFVSVYSPPNSDA